MISRRTGSITPDLTGNDPLELLHVAAQHNDPALLRTVEDELRTAEVEAARGASPTPYASEVIRAANAAGRRVAIVSNNSAEAIEVSYGR